MFGVGTKQALSDFTASVLAVKPLVEGLAAPVTVTPFGCSTSDRRVPGVGERRRAQALLDRVARGVGVKGLVLDPGRSHEDLAVFDRIVNRRLSFGEVLSRVGPVPTDRLAEVDPVVSAVVHNALESVCDQQPVRTRDGLILRALSAGSGSDVVVLVPACGMPVSLAENWIRFFARDRTVLTWESRGLFGPMDTDGEYAVDLASQIEDFFAVMDRFGAGTADVVGLCGGAAIALGAAATNPQRIRSLSLWHGAYGFSDDYAMTDHQRGLIALMGDAARSRTAARSVHSAFCRAVLAGTPDELAHLVLYPYATPEMLFRYCQLNLGITSADVTPYVRAVRQPALVVTSRDDDIAHPDGSRRVAAGLVNSQLYVAPHGDHVALFAGADAALEMAGTFLRRASAI